MRTLRAPVALIALLGFAATAANQGAAEERFCGGSTTGFAEDMPLPSRAGGPFDIQLQFDAILESTVNEPYTITAGVNDKLRFTINGVGPFNVTLTPGTSLDADSVAADINRDANFRPVADARESDQFGNAPGEGTILIRSQGSASGSIQLLSVADDAYTTLGLTQYEGSTVNESATVNEQDVLSQAAEDWEGVMQDAGLTVNPFLIRVAFYQLDPDSAAIASAGLDTTSTGDIARGRSRYDRNTNWFVDPTPHEDTEFDENGLNGPPGTDLLSVARHEMGHSLGLSSGHARFWAFVSSDSATFDGSRLNVGLGVGGPHTSSATHPNDLMNPSIGTRRRRPISIYPVASALSRIAEYDIPQVCVDADAVTAADGSVTNPWPLISPANANEPAGNQGLLIPGNHDVGLGVLLDVVREWKTARGGSAVIGVP